MMRTHNLRVTATANVTAPKSTPRPAPGGLMAKVQRPPKLPKEQTLLMQAFGWESAKHGHWWQLLASKVPDIAASGVTHVWLPPPSASVSPEGYLPGQLYDLNSSYGSKEDLVALNTALLEAGIRPVADIVINHRSADEQNEDGVWNQYRDDVPHPGKKIDWGEWAVVGDDEKFDGTGNPDTGEGYGPSPDIDHANSTVREGLLDWLKWLRSELGFEGWRFDYVKGYAPEYTKEYVGKTVGADVFSVGEDFSDLAWTDGKLEYNQDGARQRLCDWVAAAGGCPAFDFPTKGLLQEAIAHCQYDRLRDGEGKPPGLLGWAPGVAVTFIDNHDTGSSQAVWPFPSEGVMQGYAYILTHPGMPTIFWEHYFDWGLKAEIDALVQVRQRNGIVATSPIHVQAANHDMYVACINDRVVVKLGPAMDMGDLVPKESEGWHMASSGDNWAVWERKA